MSNLISVGVNNPNELARRSLATAKSFRLKGRLSKLHLKVRSSLGLSALGFIGEQCVGGKYVADESIEQLKLIVEINGDYVHANPNKFKASDIIKVKGSTYTAEEKWVSDKKRLEYLNSIGYRVIIVWESDDLELKKVEILKALGILLDTIPPTGVE